MATINDIAQADRLRFATAFLFSNDHQAVDWESAAAQYDADVMVQSFKTVTQRALKKVIGPKPSIPDGDVNRFALCFIFTKKPDVDWTKAAAAYDPKVKAASYRTVTQRALKKVEFANHATVSSKKTQAKKRKAVDKDEDYANGEEDGASLKAKKSKVLEATHEEDQAVESIESTDQMLVHHKADSDADDWNRSPGLSVLKDEDDTYPSPTSLSLTESKIDATAAENDRCAQDAELLDAQLNAES